MPVGFELPEGHPHQGAFWNDFLRLESARGTLLKDEWIHCCQCALRLGGFFLAMREILFGKSNAFLDARE